jgi:hypothetical protein
MSSLKGIAKSTASKLILAFVSVGIGEVLMYFNTFGDSIQVKIGITFVSYVTAGVLVFIATRTKRKA